MRIRRLLLIEMAAGGTGRIEVGLFRVHQRSCIPHVVEEAGRSRAEVSLGESLLKKRVAVSDGAGSSLCGFISQPSGSLQVAFSRARDAEPIRALQEGMS